MRGIHLPKPSVAVSALAMVLAASTGLLAVGSAGASAQTSPSTDAALDHALHALVRAPEGPPGIAVIVQRNGTAPTLHRAGTANLATGAPIRSGDSMRLASVAKAFSGAVALSVVTQGDLSLNDTVATWIPGLPKAWAPVTLRELLQHTSGIPDYTRSKRLAQDFMDHPDDPPPPRALVSYAKRKLEFSPGSTYEYSNTDNVLAALMVEAATGRSYESELARQVFGPYGLPNTSLPRGDSLPAPFIHGYDPAPPAPPEDVTFFGASGWAWASGGIVSTPRDANAFVRAYVSGSGIDPQTRQAQFTFRPGQSDPPGPGQNSAGLALFRYQTRCGTVYGHTGNLPGFTQFVAASPDGKSSVVVSANSQNSLLVRPHVLQELRQIYTLGVCAALHR